jgi:hypothetical protein
VVVRLLHQSPQNGDIVVAPIEAVESEGTVKTHQKVDRQGGGRVAADVTMDQGALPGQLCGAILVAGSAVPMIYGIESESNPLTKCSIEFRFEETDIRTGEVP